MSIQAYPGLFRDPRHGRLWPALLCSVAVHGLLFWGFSRFDLKPEILPSVPLYTIELAAAPGGGAGPAKAEAPNEESSPAPLRQPAKAEPPPPQQQPREERTRDAKLIPKSEPEPPKSAARSPEKLPPPVATKPPAPEAPTEKGAKALPLAGSREARTPPPAPEKAIAEAPTAPAPAQPQPSAKSSPDSDGEKQLAERLARLRQRREEQGIEERIERLRREKAGNDEESVAKKIASLRSRVAGPSERASTGEREGSGGSGHVGVRGASGNVLQDVRMSVFTANLWEKVHANWSVPPSLEGKGYVAVVCATWNRQGKLLQLILEKSSGNQLYDRLAMRAVETTSAKGDLAIPREIPGESLEVGLRFRRDE